MEKWVPVLENLGFTKVESKVYITLLKLGSSLAGKISKEAQLNRTTTYDALKNLIDKGLVSHVTQANRKWFKATNPEILFELLKEREEEAKKVIPALAMLYKTPKEEHQVTLYYGIKGIKSVFQDMLREGKPMYIIDSECMFYDKMPYYAPQFIKEVEKKRIKIKHLVRRGVDVHPSKTTEVRYVSENLSSLSVISIYGNKLAITMWTDPPESVIIKNKASADLLKSYFDILWKNANSN